MLRDSYGSPSELVRNSFGSSSVPTEGDPIEISTKPKEIPWVYQSKPKEGTAKYAAQIEAIEI